MKNRQNRRKRRRSSNVCLSVPSSMIATAVFVRSSSNLEYTLCLKKVPTFFLSTTLSNLNQFLKFLHCWKAYEIYYKTYRHYPPHLTHVAILPGDSKNLNFCRYSHIWKKTQINCILSTPILIPLRVLSVFMCFCQNLVLVAEYHVDC